MSRLIALVFDDQFKGEEARAELHRLAGEGLLAIDDTVIIVKKPDGKTAVSPEDKVTGKGQKAGHVAGRVVAALTANLPSIPAGTTAGRLCARPLVHRVHPHILSDSELHAP